MAAENRTFRSFMVMYKADAGTAMINTKIKTESLLDLHRILCSMNGYNKPMAEWDTVVVHEHRDSGEVLEMSKDDLKEFDYLYPFKGRSLALEEKEDTSIGGKLTEVYVRRHTNVTTVLNEKSLLRSYGYAH